MTDPFEVAGRNKNFYDGGMKILLINFHDIK